MEKCLDKNIGQGNPICSLETLHQGNLRHHGSCKDDIDRFKIPLFHFLIAEYCGGLRFLYKSPMKVLAPNYLIASKLRAFKETC